MDKAAPLECVVEGTVKMPSQHGHPVAPALGGVKLSFAWMTKRLVCNYGACADISENWSALHWKTRFLLMRLAPHLCE
jgi:hypothetical protein